MYSVSIVRPGGHRRNLWSPNICDFWEPTTSMTPLATWLMLERMRGEDGVELNKKESNVANSKYFEKLNLGGFEPSDIKVKVQGRSVIVEAKKEITEEQDGMYSRSFREVRRTLNLPENVDKKNLKSAFTNEGILEIDAPLLTPIENVPSEKTEVPIDVAIDNEEQENSGKDGSIEDVVDE